MLNYGKCPVLKLGIKHTTGHFLKRAIMTGMSYRRTLFGDVQQAALRVLLGHNKAISGTFRVAEQGSALPFSAIPEKCPVVWELRNIIVILRFHFYKYRNP